MSTSRDRHHHRRLWLMVPVCVACASLLVPSSAVRAADCPTIIDGHLIIPPGCTHVITGTVAYASVSVRAKGTLKLGAGALLDVFDSIDVHTQGAFCFNGGDGGPTPTLRAVGIINDLEISGTITVEGAAGGLISRVASAVVTLNSDGKLIAQGGDLIITAPMQIDGTVRATSSADLIFVMNAPSAASAGLVHVDNANARVLFLVGSAQTYTGDLDFRAEAGEIVINDSVETAGGTRIDTGGKMTVASGESFKSTGAFYPITRQPVRFIPFGSH